MKEGTVTMSDTFIHTLLADWDEERSLSREEAVAILDLPKEEMEDLISCAYALRTKYKGKKVSVQLLTNVRSGNCSQNCAYCAVYIRLKDFSLHFPVVSEPFPASFLGMPR